MRACLTALLMTLVVAANAAASEVTTVPRVDLERYLGRWYEIARLPSKFQADCDRAEAHYSLLADGKVQVVNTCFGQDSVEPRRVEGVAEVVDETTNAKLKVSFVPAWLRWTGIGRGDYWIIMLADDYHYAVVSEPKRRYLWILAREPQLPEATLDAILDELKQREFVLDDLIRRGAP